KIDGRHGSGDTRTDAMRIMHDRIMAVGADGSLTPTDDMFIRYGAVHGNNGTNGQKGGTYYGNMMAVVEATKTGMSYKVPLVDMQSKLLGLDGTHLGMTFAFFGTTEKLVPGVMFTAGSHTGAGYAAKVRSVAWDTASNSLKDLGSVSIAPYDRHLY